MATDRGEGSAGGVITGVTALIFRFGESGVDIRDAGDSAAVTGFGFGAGFLSAGFIGCFTDSVFDVVTGGSFTATAGFSVSGVFFAATAVLSVTGVSFADTTGISVTGVFFSATIGSMVPLGDCSGSESG